MEVEDRYLEQETNDNTVEERMEQFTVREPKANIGIAVFFLSLAAAFIVWTWQGEKIERQLALMIVVAPCTLFAISCIATYCRRFIEVDNDTLVLHYYFKKPKRVPIEEITLVKVAYRNGLTIYQNGKRVYWLGGESLERDIMIRYLQPKLPERIKYDKISYNQYVWPYKRRR